MGSRGLGQFAREEHDEESDRDGARGGALVGLDMGSDGAERQPHGASMIGQFYFHRNSVGNSVGNGPHLILQHPEFYAEQYNRSQNYGDMHFLNGRGNQGDEESILSLLESPRQGRAQSVPSIPLELNRQGFENYEIRPTAHSDAGHQSSVASYSLETPLGSQERRVVIGANDAKWFLKTLESFHMAELDDSTRKYLQDSDLRKEDKHRHSVFFQNDATLIRFVHHENGPFLQQQDHIQQDGPQKAWVKAAAKVLAEVYRDDIPKDNSSRAQGGCIWSALLKRAEYLLRAFGVAGTSLEKSNTKNKEQSLTVGDYHISRSNLRKIIMTYINVTERQASSE